MISNFQYFPLVWLFCTIAEGNLINRKSKRAMRMIYTNDNDEALNALLQKDGILSIHIRNLQILMVEVYKTINHLNPPYMWNLFTKNVLEYDFRITVFWFYDRDLVQIH